MWLQKEHARVPSHSTDQRNASLPLFEVEYASRAGQQRFFDADELDSVKGWGILDDCGWAPSGGGDRGRLSGLTWPGEGASSTPKENFSFGSRSRATSAVNAARLCCS